MCYTQLSANSLSTWESRGLRIRVPTTSLDFCQQWAPNILLSDLFLLQHDFSPLWNLFYSPISGASFYELNQSHNLHLLFFLLSNAFLVGGSGVLSSIRQLHYDMVLNWLRVQSRDIFFWWWYLLDGEIMSLGNNESLLPESILEKCSKEHHE
jgi:hypothetical protein